MPSKDVVRTEASKPVVVQSHTRSAPTKRQGRTTIDERIIIERRTTIEPRK